MCAVLLISRYFYLLLISLQREWALIKVDMKKDFLNAEVDGEIYAGHPKKAAKINEKEFILQI